MAITNLPVLELRKEKEEWIVQNLLTKDRGTQLLAYKFLHTIGCKMDNIDDAIVRLLRDEARAAAASV